MSKNERELKLARIGMEEIMKAMPPAYAKLFIRARRDLAELRLKNDKQIIKIWTEAAEEISKEMRKLGDGYRKEYLRSLLLDILKILNAEYRDLMKQDISEAIKIQYMFQKDIIASIAKEADVANIGPAKLAQVYTGLARETTEAFLARKVNGISLSTRIWRNNQAVMAQVIKAATSGHLSAYDMGLMLEKYMKKDRDSLNVRESQALMEAFDGRLPKDLKYDSFRLARTEISNAFAEGTYSAGAKNPFYLGIDWRLSGRHDPKLKCVCPQLVGFHPKGSEPPIPHPQCMCQQLPRIKSMDTAVDEMIAWVNNPSSNRKLEDWYQNIYLKHIA
mgnify:CR=1 FL=1